MRARLLTSLLLGAAMLVVRDAAAVKPAHHGHPPAAAANARVGAAHRAAAKPVAKPHAAAEDEVEMVEDVAAVDVTPSEASGDGNSNQQAPIAGAKLWGHLHPAAVHLPIAWLIAWSMVECLALVWANPWLRKGGAPIGLATALSFAPAVYSGLMRFDELSGNRGYDAAPALQHRNMLFAAWAGASLLLAIRVLRVPRHGFLTRFGYTLLLLACTAATGWAAHLGGKMVYGDEFLPF